MPTPTIGSIVHYISQGSPVLPDGTQKYESTCRAAIVTEADPDNPERIGLQVSNPTGLFFHSLADGGCLYSDGDGPNATNPGSPQGGTWHWPDPVD
jgi:hypothetical protein